MVAILFMLVMGGIGLWLNLQSKRAHDRMEEKRQRKKHRQ
jgi:CHASE3 domain sensor protein